MNAAFHSAAFCAKQLAKRPSIDTLLDLFLRIFRLQTMVWPSRKHLSRRGHIFFAPNQTVLKDDPEFPERFVIGHARDQARGPESNEQHRTGAFYVVQFSELSLTLNMSRQNHRRGSTSALPT